MASKAHWLEDDDEWELVNDDGFVYKRRKRHHAYEPPPPPPDLVVEEKKNRRERKKMALLKIKASYQREIHHWELLSSTLNNLKEKSSQQISVLDRSNYKVTAPSLLPEQSSVVRSGQLVDELLAQAEVQAAIIRDISNLCEEAERLCSAKEESFKQMLVELPIWASSSRELMTSLCDST